MINAVDNYCTEWGLAINAVKTHIQVLSNYRCDVSYDFLLNHHRLTIVDKFKYLGVTLNTNNRCKDIWNSHKEATLRSAKKQTYRILPIKNLLPIQESLKSYECFVMPRLTYACASISGHRKCKDTYKKDADELQHYFASRLLSTWPSSSKEAVRGELGIHHFQTRIDYLNLCYQQKIQAAKFCILTQQVLAREDTKTYESSWNTYIQNVLCKYYLGPYRTLQTTIKQSMSQYEEKQ